MRVNNQSWLRRKQSTSHISPFTSSICFRARISCLRCSTRSVLRLRELHSSLAKVALLWAARQEVLTLERRASICEQSHLALPWQKAPTHCPSPFRVSSYPFHIRSKCLQGTWAVLVCRQGLCFLRSIKGRKTAWSNIRVSFLRPNSSELSSTRDAASAFAPLPLARWFLTLNSLLLDCLPLSRYFLKSTVWFLGAQNGSKLQNLLSFMVSFFSRSKYSLDSILLMSRVRLRPLVDCSVAAVSDLPVFSLSKRPMVRSMSICTRSQSLSSVQLKLELSCSSSWAEWAWAGSVGLRRFSSSFCSRRLMRLMSKQCRDRLQRVVVRNLRSWSVGSRGINKNNSDMAIYRKDSVACVMGWKKQAKSKL